MNEDFVPIVFRRAQALTLDSCGLKNRPTSIDVPENGRVMFYFCFFSLSFCQQPRCFVDKKVPYYF